MIGCKVSLIAAVDQHLAIGRAGDIPWQVQGGVAFFQTKTRGCPVIMGRRTYEWIMRKAGHPLRNRVSIVLTNNDDLTCPGCVTAYSRDDALRYAARLGADEVYVIGGEQIYHAFFPFADKLWLTHIEARDPESVPLPSGDIFFPAYQHCFRQRRLTPRRDEGPYAVRFGEYDRIKTVH